MFVPAYVPSGRQAQAAVPWAFTVFGEPLVIEVTSGPVELTESAANRIAEILRGEPEGSLLRIGVDGGGCSGFTYTYDISLERLDGDLVIERGGAIVAIDPISLDLLRGAKVDYVDGLMGSMFKIENPIATASCGCGSSFAI